MEVKTPKKKILRRLPFLLQDWIWKQEKMLKSTLSGRRQPDFRKKGLIIRQIDVQMQKILILYLPFLNGRLQLIVNAKFNSLYLQWLCRLVNYNYFLVHQAYI